MPSTVRPKGRFCWRVAQVGLLLLMPAAGFAQGLESVDIPSEQRQFSILVDGKPAGSFRLTVSDGKDGETIAQCEADVRVRYFLFSYGYSYRGREVWKGDEFLRAVANADDGGKKTAVSAEVVGNGSDLLVNGQRRRDAAFGWSTSYWRLPPSAGQVQAVRVVDLDTGEILNTRLWMVASERLHLAGSTLSCAHYRVGGDAEVDLWYDAQGRLVRQTSTEAGHETEIVLAAIRRPTSLSMK